MGKKKKKGERKEYRSWNRKKQTMRKKREMGRREGNRRKRDMRKVTEGR